MEPPVGHVVHLESALGTAPPARLRLPRRLGGPAKAAVGAVLVIGAVIAAVGIASLWTAQTPGLWFSILFTVLLGGLTLGFWAAYLVSFGSAAQARRAEAAWEAGCATAVPADGRVTDRKVAVTDTGRVSGFDLTIALPDGTVVAAWHGRGEPILQPQVPGVGAPVRVWRADGALVVEVVDPTVVVS